MNLDININGTEDKQDTVFGEFIVILENFIWTLKEGKNKFRVQETKNINREQSESAAEL